MAIYEVWDYEEVQHHLDGLCPCRSCGRWANMIDANLDCRDCARDRARLYNLSPQGRARSRAGTNRRRARKLNQACPCDPKGPDMIRLRAHYDDTCAVCGSRQRLHIDHVEPMALGGLHCLGNLQVLCQRCNYAKRALPLEEWLARDWPGVDPSQIRAKMLPCPLDADPTAPVD